MLLVACGGGGGGGGSGPGTALDYFPIEPRAFWHYADQAGATTSVRVNGQRTTAFGPVWVFEVQSPQGQDESLFRLDGSSVRQVNPDAAPSTMRDVEILRLPPTVGQEWRRYVVTFLRLADIDGDGVAEDVTLRSDAAVIDSSAVATPAGRIDGAMLVRTVDVQSGTLTGSGQPFAITLTSDDWYAPGIGLVRNVITVNVNGATQQRQEHLLVGYRVGNLRSDHTPPQVSTRSPLPGSLAAAAIVRVAFNEPMDTTVPSAGLALRSPSGQAVAGSPRWLDNQTLVFEPAQPLTSGRYEVTVSAPLADVYGNTLATPETWTFDIDASGPVVTAANPGEGATDVALNSVLTITFDEPIDPASATANRVVLSDDYGLVPTQLSVSGRDLRITPQSPLRLSQRYRLNVEAGVSDTFGNPGLAFTTQFFSDSGRFELPDALPGVFGAGVTRGADLDADGRIDVVGTVISPSDGAIVDLLHWRQLANGTLASPTRLPSTAGCQVDSFAVADVDGDGRRDVMVAFGTSGNCAPEWLRQQPDGTFVRQGPIGTANRYGIRALPVAADGGRPAMLAMSDLDIVIQRQTAPGVFGQAQPLAIQTIDVSIMELADVDADGMVDLIFARRLVGGGQGILVLHQLADGSFGRPLELALAGPSAPLALAVADIDGDGRLDLLVSDALSGTQMSIYRQTAPGQFAAAATMVLPALTVRIVLADIDGDGRSDLITSHADGPTALAVQLRRADGSFDAAEFYSRVGGAGHVEVIDLSGDGRLDVMHGHVLWRQRSQPGALSASAQNVHPLRRGAARIGQLARPSSP